MRSLILCLLLTLSSTCARAAFAIQPWPEAAESLQMPPMQHWIGPARAERPFELCALYPHLRDAYWLSVNQGMVEEARRLGVGLRVHEAGGYAAQDEQARQLAECAREGSDAILLGAVDGPALAEAIGQSPLPVFGLVNALPPSRSSPRSVCPGIRWAGASATGWPSAIRPVRRRGGSPSCRGPRAEAATTWSSPALPPPLPAVPSSWSKHCAATTAARSSAVWCNGC